MTGLVLALLESGKRGVTWVNTRPRMVRLL
jgi:hypothetical protein